MSSVAPLNVVWRLLLGAEAPRPCPLPAPAAAPNGARSASTVVASARACCCASDRAGHGIGAVALIAGGCLSIFLTLFGARQVFTPLSVREVYLGMALPW
jgi:hypothetical protein